MCLECGGKIFRTRVHFIIPAREIFNIFLFDTIDPSANMRDKVSVIKIPGIDSAVSTRSNSIPHGSLTSCRSSRSSLPPRTNKGETMVHGGSRARSPCEISMGGKKNLSRRSIRTRGGQAAGGGGGAEHGRVSQSTGTYVYRA